MPYIRPSERKKVDPFIDNLIAVVCAEQNNDRDGIMNYILTKLVKCVYTYGGTAKVPELIKYYRFQKALGLFAAVNQEFYRIYVAPYEDKKRKENGAVE